MLGSRTAETATQDVSRQPKQPRVLRTKGLQDASTWTIEVGLPSGKYVSCKKCDHILEIAGAYNLTSYDIGLSIAGCKRAQKQSQSGTKHSLRPIHLTHQDDMSR